MNREEYIQKRREMIFNLQRTGAAPAHFEQRQVLQRIGGIKGGSG